MSRAAQASDVPRPLLVATTVVLLAGASLLAARLHAGAQPEIAVVEEVPPPSSTPDPLLVVDVAGAVARPGVYQLPAGARVVDALRAAGGTTSDADLQALNKAAPIRDGQRIYVPRPGELVPASAPGDPQLKVDLNQATAAELEQLPGIGPATAARIIRSRAGQRFTKIEELQTRGLVAPRVFADLRDLVTAR
jgi:competence protein ComEA